MPKLRKERKHRQRGWTLPGYNYLGPGNSLDNGPPTSFDDAVAQVHDNDYQDYIDQGLDPYWNYNEADDKAIDQWGNSVGGLIGKGVFKTKKFLAHHKVLGTIQKTSKRRHPFMVNWGETRTKKQIDEAVDAQLTAKNQRLREADRAQKEQESRDTNRKTPAPMPNRIPDDNEPMDAGNGVSLMSTSSTRGTNGRSDGSETSVDIPRNPRLRAFKETQDVIMPWYNTGTFNIDASNTSAGQNAFGFRLNSINDIITANTYVADPTPAADVADGVTNNIPMMYNYWSAIYRYWTVTRSHYKVRFWCTTPHNDGEFSVWTYHNGQQNPPLLDGTARIPDWVRQMHPHAHVKHFTTKTTDNGVNTYRHGIEITGHYEPGNYTVVNDVAEDEFKETWHKWSEVPSLREVATFIINKSDRMVAVTDTMFAFGWDAKIIYQVQLKDLKAIYQYPKGSDDFPTIADYMNEI